MHEDHVMCCIGNDPCECINIIYECVLEVFKAMLMLSAPSPGGTKGTQAFPSFFNPELSSNNSERGTVKHVCVRV